MPSQKLVNQSFSDWRSGPWHSLGPDKGPQFGHRYGCINMQVYENGTLGVRPCLVRVDPSNWTETRANFDGTAFFSQGYYYQLDAFSLKYLYVFEGTTTPRRLHVDTSPVLATPTVSTAAAITTQPKVSRYSTNHQQAISTLSSLEVNDGDGIYGGDAVITTFGGTPGATAITHPASWDPHTILKFRDRYWSWGDSSNQNRIHYSVPGDYTDWTASGTTGSIDVGADPNLPIVGVWPLYDSLIIAMRDLRWFLFRFTDDPQFGEIRYIGTKRIPDFAVQVAETGDSLVFLTENGGIVSITPNSIDDVSLDHIRVPTGTPLTTDHYFYRGLAAHDRNSICLPFGVNGIPANSAKEIFTGDMSLDFINGVWVQSMYFGTNTQRS